MRLLYIMVITSLSWLALFVTRNTPVVATAHEPALIGLFPWFFSLLRKYYAEDPRVDDSKHTSRSPYDHGHVLQTVYSTDGTVPASGEKRDGR
jgi:hypothetical protein